MEEIRDTCARKLKRRSTQKGLADELKPLLEKAEILLERALAHEADRQREQEEERPEG